ncbi:Ubiquitin family protein [Phytophthora palmivora]|uniref:Ubiquitin family protein n=1 Tax=Phytophthora palmivora TaxID=4796 RepID=A0A2P4Y0U2_9STRA|nr:Ubiquitin family protein [Phytophthora palmivora]
METPATSATAVADDALHLRLKTLDERVFDVEATSSMMVADFRAKVALATAVPAPRQRLIYRGKLLKDGAALAAYDLQDGHTVHLVAKPPATASTTQTVEDEPARVRRRDGPAWNLANLRSALRRTETSATPSNQPLPMLREILDEMSESPQDVADGMGLGRAEPAVDLEPITQGILTMRTVLSTAAMEATSPVRRGPRQFFVGQWLDVKDTVNQWLEATVLAVADGKVLVHYHGWPTRWDEWIDVDSARIAAFRTRTLHRQNMQRLSPIPTTRVPSAPRVGDDDVRRMVVDVRNLMREMMPHIDRLADLCQEELTREVAAEATDATRDSDVSEVSHLVAPLFDRFGRLLVDSAGYLDPLLRPELRGSSQRQQERRSAALRRGTGTSERQEASVSETMEAQDNSLSIRDLIATSPNTVSEPNQRRSIDVHIHAIVAPASLSSFASLNRGNNNTGNSSDEGTSTRRLQTPSTPPTRHSLGFDDHRTTDDEADHSRVPLLGSYRHRSHSQTSESSQQQQRAVARDLDEFLSDDFFGTSFGRDADGDDSDDDSSISYTHSDAMQSSRSAYRPPSPSGRVSSPRTPQSEDSHTQYSSGTIGVIPEVAAAEERLRAQAVASQRNGDNRPGDNGRASSASAESSSSSSSSFPTFLEVMRRTLSGVRNFVHNEASSSPTQENNNPVELASGFSLPSLSPSLSSSSSLSTPPVSPVVHSSIDNPMSSPGNQSDSSIDEDLDLDEVD